MQPTPRQSGIIITFYSYKGGTGRTMALANTACLLSRHLANNPQRALMLDWDLEAPGLHKFFTKELDETESRPGIIDYFHTLKQRLEETEELYPKLTEPDGWKVLNDILPLDDYLTKDMLPGIDFIKAGKMDADYATLVRSFNWVEFYEKFELAIEVFRDLLINKYAYALIDSRTGLNDTSGICTMLLPEKLVAVFTPNEQSLEGVIDLVKRALPYRQASRDFRPLAVFPLPSRIELAEKDLRSSWRKRYQSDFEEVFRLIYDAQECELTPYFNEVQLPHMSYYAYGESVAVWEERSEALSLSRAYEEFFRRLIELDVAWAQLDNTQVDSTPLVVRRTAGATIEYIDFDLKFEEISSGNHIVSAHSFIGGGWRKWQLPALPPFSKTRGRVLTDSGQKLFNAIFQDRIEDIYNKCLRGLKRHQQICIKIDVSNQGKINEIPWELLFDPMRGPLVLFDTPIVRYILPRPLSNQELIAPRTLKVLLTSAAPQPLEPIDFELETKHIQDALAYLGKDVEITIEPHLSERKLRELLQNQRFHIWHFAGHSGVDDQGWASRLFLEDDKGNIETIAAPNLGFMLSGSFLRLVVFSAPSNAATASNLFFSIVPTLIQARIPAVVMMQEPISIKATHAFIDSFYHELARGLPIEACMTEARKAIANATSFSQPDWACPILYTGAPVKNLLNLPRSSTT